MEKVWFVPVHREIAVIVSIYRKVFVKDKL